MEASTREQTCSTLIERGAYICIRSDGDFLYTGDSNGFLHVWDTRTMQNVQVIDHNGGYVVEIVPSEKYLFVLYYAKTLSGNVVVYDSLSLAFVTILPGTEVSLSDNAVIVQDGETLYFNTNGKVKTFDVYTLEETTASVLADLEEVRKVLITDTKLITLSATDAFVYDTASHELVSSFPVSFDADCQYAAATNGKLFISDELNTKRIYVYAIDTSGCVATLESTVELKRSLLAVDNVLYRGVANGIEVWDVRTMSMCNTIPVQQDVVVSMTICCDRLYSVYKDIQITML